MECDIQHLYISTSDKQNYWLEAMKLAQNAGCTAGGAKQTEKMVKDDVCEEVDEESGRTSQGQLKWGRVKWEVQDKSRKRKAEGEVGVEYNV